jgi:hypothetical protein
VNVASAIPEPPGHQGIEDEKDDKKNNCADSQNGTFGEVVVDHESTNTERRRSQNS